MNGTAFVVVGRRILTIDMDEERRESLTGDMYHVHNPIRDRAPR